jgi:NADPH-dependent 2,4-dienoyl-CoA reductase/sulfur reductase-like enzyme/CxxC motif-containing protein
LKTISAVVIGAGPAGLACAIRLNKSGISDVLVIERGSQLGGILNQCIHPGFGTLYYEMDLNGPEYASKMIKEFLALNISYKLRTMAINLTKDKIITVTSLENGIEQYRAKTVIIATGCRERTRENLEIPGTRPAGIFTAGQAQELINIRNYRIGNKVIIQGSGDIGLIMARRMKIEGYEVVKVLERLPFLSGLIRNKVQCLDDYGIPIDFNTQITEIKGKDRVEGVYTEDLDDNYIPIPDTRKFYDCDTVLFSVGLIPEIEIAKKSNIIMYNPLTAEVNNKYETSNEGVFVCGNALHIHDLADNASFEAEKTASHAVAYLTDIHKYKLDIKNHKPYHDKSPESRFTKLFFKELKDRKVCIICPKGCMLDGVSYNCDRGKNFYENEIKGKKRRLSTTIYCRFNDRVKRFPVISVEEIDISKTEIIKIKLKTIKELKNTSFSIELDNEKINFNAVIN